MNQHDSLIIATQISEAKHQILDAIKASKSYSLKDFVPILAALLVAAVSAGIAIWSLRRNTNYDREKRLDDRKKETLHLIRKIYGELVSLNSQLEELGLLKNKWMVSMQAILYRAEDLGVITENHKRYLINRFNQLQIRRREPKELDVTIERGHLLRDLITKYRSKQKMNVKQIAEFFYMKEDEFQATFNSMSNT